MSRVEDQSQTQRRVQELKQERTQLESQRASAQFQNKLVSQKAVKKQNLPAATPPRKTTAVAPPLKKQVKEETSKKAKREGDEKSTVQEHKHEKTVLQQAVKRREDQDTQDSMSQHQPADEFFDWTASVAASTGPAPTQETTGTSAPTKIPDEVYQAIVQHAYVHNAGKGQSPSVVLELNEGVFGGGASVNISTDGKGGVSIRFSGLKQEGAKGLVTRSKDELEKRLSSRGMSLKNLSFD